MTTVLTRHIRRSAVARDVTLTLVRDPHAWVVVRDGCLPLHASTDLHGALKFFARAVGEDWETLLAEALPRATASPDPGRVLTAAQEFVEVADMQAEHYAQRRSEAGDAMRDVVLDRLDELRRVVLHHTP